MPFAPLRAIVTMELVRIGPRPKVSTERKQSPRDPVNMSDADDHQQLLQILEAHGQQFLNSFGQTLETSSNKRKFEELNEFSTSEEDEEWHGFGTGNAGSDDSEDGGSIDSFHGTLGHLTSNHRSPYERRG